MMDTHQRLVRIEEMKKQVASSWRCRVISLPGGAYELCRNGTEAEAVCEFLPFTREEWQDPELKRITIPDASFRQCERLRKAFDIPFLVVASEWDILHYATVTSLIDAWREPNGRSIPKADFRLLRATGRSRSQVA